MSYHITHLQLNDPGPRVIVIPGQVFFIGALGFFIDLDPGGTRKRVDTQPRPRLLRAGAAGREQGKREGEGATQAPIID